jgi:hypothetical protein
MLLRLFMVMLVLLGVSGAASAARENGVSPDDPAPRLEVAKWMTRAGGREPDLHTEGKVQIVMFWKAGDVASDGAFRSIASILNGSEPDRIIAFAITADSQDTVERYMKDHDASRALRLAVGLDDKRKAANAWLSSAKQRELPVAVVVGADGRVRYIGSPQKPEFAEIVKRVARNRYNSKHAKQGDPKLEGARQARKARNWDTAEKLYEEAFNVDRNTYADVGLEVFDFYIVDMDKPDKAYAYADKLLEEMSGDGQFLGDLARKIATDPKIPDANRRLDVAQKAAETMHERASDAERPESLATLALVHFHKKEFDKAITFQQDAWKMAAPARKSEYRQVLDSYMAAAKRSESAAKVK